MGLHMSKCNLFFFFLKFSTLISISQCRGGTLKYLYVDGADLSIQTVQAIATNCTNIEVLSWSFAELLLDSALLYIKVSFVSSNHICL